MKRRDFIVIPVAAIAVMVLNVAIAFGMVWFYAIFIDPGQPDSYYDAFAMRAAPISSVIAGIPLMFAGGFLIARTRPGRRGLLVAAAVAVFYIIVDTAALLSANAEQSVWIWAALSYATKFVSALAGAKFGAIRTGPDSPATDRCGPATESPTLR